MKRVLLLLLMLQAMLTMAQKPLTNSRTGSTYTYLYRLDDQAVRSLYTTPQSRFNDQLLGTPIDSFRTGRAYVWHLLPGNYMEVAANYNKINYKLIEQHTALLKLLENRRDLQFVLLDTLRHPIADAQVYINNRLVPYDAAAQLYHVKHSKSDSLLYVNYQGVVNYYKVKVPVYKPYKPYDDRPWLKKLWAKWFKKDELGRYSDPKTNPGYIVFNKPEYRPGDTVKLKMWAVSRHSKRPIGDTKILVRLKEERWDNGKVIGYATPYRKGYFDYSFKLTDSLDLNIDRDYYISLESLKSAKYDLKSYNGDDDDRVYLAKREIYQQGMFRYEEYELKTNKFAVRADRTEHSPGQPVSLYFKATDDNGLNVPDGRVAITLYTQTVDGVKDQHLFVPDTLWRHQMPLDPIGETKLVIPDSIFPKARVNYIARVQLLNSNNESREETKYITFNDQPDKIVQQLDTDTLKISYQRFGKERSAKAWLYTIGERSDTLSRTRVTLPYRAVADPSIAAYLVKADSISSYIGMGQFTNNMDISGFRTADSLFIHVNSPHRTRFWYTIFDGNTVMERGSASELNYAKPFSRKESVSILVNYLWAGRTQYREQRIPYQDKYLTIDVQQPVSVFPGQQADITISVKNDKEQPVAGADLTAYAVTSKFERNSIPSIPYLGKVYPDRKFNKALNLFPLQTDGSFKLNWLRWSRQMGLDSIEYYKFTHPNTIYKQAEQNPDDSTQIAPFVVKNGDIVPVHILYIDNVPAYFSKTNDLQHYSFFVKPGFHDLRFRTDSQSILVRNIDIPVHKKLIVSVNADSVHNKQAQFRQLPDTLSKYEADLISKYLISVVPNYGDRMATLKQDNHLFLLNAEVNNYYGRAAGNNALLVGPVTNTSTTFKPIGGQPWYFLAETAASYEFEPGMIRQRAFGDHLPFPNKLERYNTITDYKQYALTQMAVDSIWQNYLDLRSRTINIFPVSHTITGASGGLMVTARKLDRRSFIKSIIVYKNDDPDYMDIFPGNSIQLGRFVPGKYRVMLLLKGNSYFLLDTVVVKPYGRSFYDAGIAAPHPPDPVSLKIAGIIDGQQRYGGGKVQAQQQIKEVFNDKYLDLSTLDEEMAGYVYAADDKLPLPGVTVRIKGTSIGAQTNSIGFFRLKVPKSGKLTFSFIGFQQEEVSIQQEKNVRIYLKSIARELTEVVVVGYGVSTRRAGILTSVTTAADQSLKEVRIVLRGNRDVTDTNKPLVIVDGVIVPMDMSTLDPTMIADIQILNSASAQGLYGAQAVGGAIIITSKKTAGKSVTEQDEQPGQQQTLRKNFSDYAFWQPRLITNADGKATFKTTFPDDITNWRTIVIGSTANKQTGITQGQIKSYKPLSANFTAPLFAVKGDVLSPVGKVLNYTTDEAHLKRSFKYNGVLQGEKELMVKNSLIDTFSVTAQGKDSLSFEYTIRRDNGYTDGEQRSIPLFEQGTLETKGTFAALDKDTTVTIQLDPRLKEGTFRAEASVLPVLLDETTHLREYEYLCNEQLASKLIGLLAEKRIRAYLNEPFKYDRNINDIIKKLQENRRTQGTWGWWKDTDEELWISLHAVEALLEAEKLGYRTKLDKQRLTDYLLYQAASYHGEDKLTVLLLLQKLDAKVDHAAVIAQYLKERDPKEQPSRYDQLRLMLIRQQYGSPIERDSLMKWMRTTMFGNVYWGNDHYSFFDNSVQVSILAYQILKAEGKHPEILAKLRNYFLEQRSHGYWRNTYESALILQNILPDLLTAAKKLEPATIVLSGDKQETVTKFPYTATLAGNARLTVTKTGTMPVYITAYQKFWNAEPEKVSKDFTVDSRFEKNASAITSEKGGEPIVLKVVVNARADADRVMVEIPIPAGCSYQSKDQAYTNNEVHREYFKNKVSIFCRTLSRGRHIFTVTLIPRYGGTYHVNPAKAEMMYFPTFYGREGMKLFDIK